jgi:hypothetical protein
MLWTIVGCWQEVEYIGPDPATTASVLEATPSEPEELPLGAASTPPAEVAGTTGPEATDTSGFANDFAESLAEPTESSSAEPEAGDTLASEGEESTTVPASETVVSDPPIEQPSDEQTAANVDKYAIPASEEGTPPAATDTTGTDQSSAADDTEIVPEAQTELPAADSSSQIAATAAPTDDASRATQEPVDDAAPITDSTASETPGASESAASDVTSAPVASDSNPRLDAWQLGSKLSLAALANDRGIASESVQQGLADCKSLAVRLGTTVADLPETALAGNRPASRQVLNHLFQQGQQIGRDLADQQGPEGAALFEVALKSNLLLVLYTPRSTSADAIADAISQAAPRAQLPASLWQPLVKMVTAKVDGADVRKAVKTFHAAVEQHLAGRAEQ